MIIQGRKKNSKISLPIKILWKFEFHERSRSDIMIKITEQNEPLEHVTQINDCVTLVTNVAPMWHSFRNILYEGLPLVTNFWDMSRTNLWKTHPIAKFRIFGHAAWHRSISGKLIQTSYQRRMSFPEIGMAHNPKLYKNRIGTHEIRMNKFSRNRSSRA